MISISDMANNETLEHAEDNNFWYCWHCGNTAARPSAMYMIHKPRCLWEACRMLQLSVNHKLAEPLGAWPLYDLRNRPLRYWPKGGTYVV